MRNENRNINNKKKKWNTRRENGLYLNYSETARIGFN